MVNSDGSENKKTKEKPSIFSFIFQCLYFFIFCCAIELFYKCNMVNDKFVFNGLSSFIELLAAICCSLPYVLFKYFTKYTYWHNNQQGYTDIIGD